LASLAFFGTLASIFSETGRQNFTKFLPLTDHCYCSNISEKIENRIVRS